MLNNTESSLQGLKGDINLVGRSFNEKSKYEILHLLGIGGFSKVFLGRDPSGKLVALKMIDKDLIIKNGKKDIIMGERDILKKMEHPFITKIYEAYQTVNLFISRKDFSCLFWNFVQEVIFSLI